MRRDEREGEFECEGSLEAGCVSVISVMVMVLSV